VKFIWYKVSHRSTSGTALKRSPNFVGADDGATEGDVDGASVGDVVEFCPA